MIVELLRHGDVTFADVHVKSSVLIKYWNYMQVFC